MKPIDEVANIEEGYLELRAGAKRLGEILGKDYVGHLTGVSLNMGYSTLRSVLILLETHVADNEGGSSGNL